MQPVLPDRVQRFLHHFPTALCHFLGSLGSSRKAEKELPCETRFGEKILMEREFLCSIRVEKIPQGVQNEKEEREDHAVSVIACLSLSVSSSVYSL
jgi:hypothetical protein